MSIKNNPGITTMPLNSRDWTKFINELSSTIDALTGSSSPPVPDPGDPPWGIDIDNFVTLDGNQTITGLKTFSGNNPRFNSFPLWNNNNVGDNINLLSADTNPAPGDYVVTYDVSETGGKKVEISSLKDEAYAFFMDD